MVFSNSNAAAYAGSSWRLLHAEHSYTTTYGSTSTNLSIPTIWTTWHATTYRYNQTRQYRLAEDVTVLNAINGPRGNEARARRLAGGMSNHTYLCVCVCVCVCGGGGFVDTLYIDLGGTLHNGAFGTIIDFIYARDDDVERGILSASIIVELDDAIRIGQPLHVIQVVSRCLVFHTKLIRFVQRSNMWRITCS